MRWSRTRPADVRASGRRSAVVETDPVVGRLREAGIAVDTTGEALSAYSYDASNYRVAPVAVAFPRTASDVVAVMRISAQAGLPVTPRGGGTSMAGNAIGPGVVIDLSRHMTRIHAVDASARYADVDAGVVLSTLTGEVERATGGALTFAPDPSSRSRATIGGAIGNDACGNHSVRYGRTSHHVLDLDVVTSDGARLTATASGVRATDPRDARSVHRAAEIAESLQRLQRQNLALLRLELGRIPRQVSGFQLANLLPEHGFNVARALVGTEGSCAIVVRARVLLVPKPANALLLCLGYADVVEAARDIPAILEFHPSAVEGIDSTIVETMRVRRGQEAVAGLPEGRAVLFVDIDGESPQAVSDTARRLLERVRRQGRLVDGRVVPDQADRAELWRVREDGAGLSSRPASGGESHAGWEDSAVAPERLPEYLHDFRTLLQQHGLTGAMYGHFGAGCMHIRIDYDLRSETGRQVFRDFTRDAAALVVAHGGSLSGEHGDGRARSSLLAVMYSPEMLAAFHAFRAIWDPEGRLNPGVIIEPDPLDAHLLLDGVPEREWRTHFELNPVRAKAADVDTWVHAVQSCIGVGRCRADGGGVMCPSYRATKNETDSTRGRARALQDMVRGARSPEKGWRSADVRAALDLCLSCKACSTDCPAGVDMSTYKSEFFSHYYRGRLRPMSHLSLGWLPVWLLITRHVSAAVNLVLRTPLRHLLMRIGGLTTHRSLPRFASRRQLRRELQSHRKPTSRADMILFVDSFTKGFRPDVAGSALRVALGSGRSVACETDSCCGLTWISTGQLGIAKAALRRTISRLDSTDDVPIVVVEPSCAAALKKDAPELLQTEATRRVARRVRSYAEAVVEWVDAGWRPPSVPTSATVQTHCHEYSVFGPAIQRTALIALGVHDIREATGCCGVAGNFGFEAGHFDVSMKVAAQGLMPALESTPGGTPVLSDGFSCSMQVRQLRPEQPSLHLAEFIESACGPETG